MLTIGSSSSPSLTRIRRTIPLEYDPLPCLQVHNAILIATIFACINIALVFEPNRTKGGFQGPVLMVRQDSPSVLSMKHEIYSPHQSMIVLVGEYSTIR